MTVHVIGQPAAIALTSATFEALADALDAAQPNPRTGAAFVKLDTRVLRALLAERSQIIDTLRKLHDVCPVDCDYHGKPLDEELGGAVVAAESLLARIANA